MESTERFQRNSCSALYLSYNVTVGLLMPSQFMTTAVTSTNQRRLANFIDGFMIEAKNVKN